ncbi:MAG: glycosyltransferase family 2 protein [Ruminiclostridium sp.]|nr:glycosyltransferase family 2 protein [Ruminiclostridium sp.]
MRLKNEKELDLTIVMPCLNEENTVGKCIDEAKRFISAHGIAAEIIVVDNGSTDASAEKAREHGVLVIPEERRGYGRAIITGLEHSRGGVILIGDCDTTYDFLHLEEFYFPLSRGESDIVIGDRFSGGIEKGAMPALHRLGIPFLSWCGRVKFGSRVHDFHCGLRGITRDAVRGAEYTCDGMEFATEMIADAARRGLRTGQSPTVLRKCVEPRSSKLNTVKDGFRHLRYILGSKNKQQTR